MKRSWGLGISFRLLASTTACKPDGPSLSDDGPERSCQAPSSTVIGHAHQRGRLTVRPGQTLRVHAVHYTDDCAAGGAGTGQTVSKLQLVLQSRYRVTPLVTLHPKGASSAFTTTVTIPSTTFSEPAKLFDAFALPHGVIPLVVRR
jgi:hypothetical protein